MDLRVEYKKALAAALGVMLGFGIAGGGGIGRGGRVLWIGRNSGLKGGSDCLTSRGLRDG